jgi:hypothetical protein
VIGAGLAHARNRLSESQVSASGVTASTAGGVIAAGNSFGGVPARGVRCASESRLWGVGVGLAHKAQESGENDGDTLGTMHVGEGPAPVRRSTGRFDSNDLPLTELGVETSVNPAVYGSMPSVWQLRVGTTADARRHPSCPD